MLTVKGWDEEGWVMGNVFNRVYFSIFDMGKRRIGFVGHPLPETFPVAP